MIKQSRTFDQNTINHFTELARLVDEDASIYFKSEISNALSTAEAPGRSLLTYYLVLREVLSLKGVENREWITAALAEVLLPDVNKETIETIFKDLRKVIANLVKDVARELHAKSEHFEDLEIWSFPEQGLHTQTAEQTSSSQRKYLGSYYTTSVITSESLSMLDLSKVNSKKIRVLDPACGTGNFLVAFYKVARQQGLDSSQVKHSLYGIEIDEVAARLCRARILLLDPHIFISTPTQLESQIINADALAILLDYRMTTQQTGGMGNNPTKRWKLPLGDFSHVIGNPPFINRIRAASSGGNNSLSLLTQETRHLIQAAPYTDISAIFLNLAADIVTDRGWIVMVQPVSFLAARDSEAIRASLLSQTQLRAAIFDHSKSFSAVVDTVTLVFYKGPPSTYHTVTIKAISKTGTIRKVVTTLSVESRSLSQLAAIASAVPLPIDLHLDHTSDRRSIEELAFSTADFRDQFYYIKANVTEELAHGSQDNESLKVITVGSIEPSKVLWGENYVLIGGKKYLRPVLSKKGSDNPKVLEWLVKRSRAKVLVATQSEVIESVVDLSAQLIGSVPVISVTPKRQDDIFAIQSMLSSSALSAVAIGRHIGSGLSHKALKLSASQIAALPLPSNQRPWQKAAEIHSIIVEQGITKVDELLEMLKEADTYMQQAYALDSQELHAWWFSRVTRYLKRHLKS